MRIFAPARVYQQETRPVCECVIMDLTRIFRGPVSRVKPRLNHSIETNHFTPAVVGPLVYEEGRGLCKGRDASVNGKPKVSLWVTKNLEVTTKSATAREGFNSRDILVTENGVSIPANLRQGQGVNADFGTLLLR